MNWASVQGSNISSWTTNSSSSSSSSLLASGCSDEERKTNLMICERVLLRLSGRLHVTSSTATLMCRCTIPAHDIKSASDHRCVSADMSGQRWRVGSALTWHISADPTCHQGPKWPRTEVTKDQSHQGPKWPRTEVTKDWSNQGPKWPSTEITMDRSDQGLK